MTEIGKIAITQIQRDPLKRGDEPNQIYIPAPLLQVSELVVTKEGVFGMGLAGQKIVDAHHTSHPKTRNTSGKRGVSIGFTAHYDAMRGQFGKHMTDGIAGENIVIDSVQSFSLADLKNGIAIENSRTGELHGFSVVMVIDPCDPFSHFCAKTKERLPAEELKSILQFLADGRRGFIITPDSDDEILVYPGDKVYLR